MSSSLTKKDFYILICISSLWIILLFISNVKGNFPINDDWSYSYSVKIFLETGRIELTGWVSMPVITQVLWGSVFASTFGFSFEILRLSTIILGLTGIICTYLLLNEITGSFYLKLITSVLVAINPIYFLLSSSFMTDVPFFTFSIISILFLFKFLKSNHILFLIIGIFFIIGASFIRQIGILIFFAFVVVYSINKNNLTAHKLYLFILAFLLLCSIAFFPSFIHSGVNDPLVHNTRMAKFFNAFTIKNFFGIVPLIKNAFVALVYIGLFSFPLWIHLISPVLNKINIRQKIFFITIFLTSAAAITLLLGIFNKLLPLRPNVLFDYGMGPATLRDVDILSLNHINKIPLAVWVVLTFIGVAGFLLMLSMLLLSIKNFRLSRLNKSSFPVYFIFLTTAFYLLTISLSDFYDRYLLLLLPLTMFLMIKFSDGQILSNNYIQRIISSLVIIVFLLFTTYETQNYFSWNRCRWQAIDYLTKELNIGKDKIDGGFEFNGWYGYDVNYIPEKGKSWWWVKDDQYIISFGPLNNYSVLKKFKYSSLTKIKYLYILIKQK